MYFIQDNTSGSILNWIKFGHRKLRKLFTHDWAWCITRMLTSARQSFFVQKYQWGGGWGLGQFNFAIFSNLFYIFCWKLIDWWNRLLLSHWHSSHRGFENFKVLIRSSLRSSIYQSYFANIVRAIYLSRPSYHWCLILSWVKIHYI